MLLPELVNLLLSWHQSAIVELRVYLIVYLNPALALFQKFVIFARQNNVLHAQAASTLSRRPPQQPPL